MKGNIEERACQLALYIIENKATVRAAAHKFGISKSTVHMEVINRTLYMGGGIKKEDRRCACPLMFFEN